MRRTKLKAVGARALRELPKIRAFRDALLLRSRGRCERCGMVPPFVEAHHVVNRARVAGWPGMHDPDLNGLALCQTCHSRLTMWPRDEGGHLEGRISRAFISFEAWRVWDRPPVWA